MTPEQEALDGVLGEIANLVRRIRRQGETHTNVRDIDRLRHVRGLLMTMVDHSIDAQQVRGGGQVKWLILSCLALACSPEPTKTKGVDQKEDVPFSVIKVNGECFVVVHVHFSGYAHGYSVAMSPVRCTL